MGCFAVIRTAGSSWVEGGTAAQAGLSDHAAYMNALSDAGFIVFAGPLSGSEHHRLRVLLIVRAETEAEVRRRLAADPWARAHMLEVASVEAWNIFVGADRMAEAAEARPMLS